MFCALCNQFIWQKAGRIEDRNVCMQCAREIAIQAALMPADNDAEEEIWASVGDTVRDEVRTAVSDAVEDALHQIERSRRAQPAAKVA